MNLITIINAYLRGDLVAIIKKSDNRYSYLRGEQVDKRFILNSCMEIIKLNIN